MSNALIVPGAGMPQLPAYALQNASPLVDQLIDNLSDLGGLQIPSIGLKNNRFNMVIDGNEFEHPGPINVIVINQLPRMSRGFYEGNYDPANPTPPACSSIDGITPDESSPAPQHSTCSGCPKAARGSKMVDGKPMTACAMHHRIVVSRTDKIGDPSGLYVMRVNASSVLSKMQQPPHMSLRDYFAWFRQQNAAGARVVPQMAVTEITFAPSTQAESPSHIRFRVAGWLPEQQAMMAMEQAQSEIVQTYLYGSEAPRAAAIPLAAPTPTAPAAAAPAPISAPIAAPSPVVQPAPAPVNVGAPAGMAGFAAAPAAAPVAAPAPAPVAPRGRGRRSPAAQAAPAPTPQAAPVAAPHPAPAPVASGFGAAPTFSGAVPPVPPAAPAAAATGFGGFAVPGAPAGAAAPGGFAPPSNAAAAAFSGFADVPPQ